MKIIPSVVCSLVAIPKQFGDRLKQIGITIGTAQIQKTSLLGMARILRKALEISTVFSFIVLLCVSSIIVIN